MTNETQSKIKELEGMTDCLYWRTGGLTEIHCHAKHPEENRPELIPGYQCTKDCGNYTPLKLKGKGGAD